MQDAVSQGLSLSTGERVVRVVGKVDGCPDYVRVEVVNPFLEDGRTSVVPVLRELLPRPRKVSRFEICERHSGWFAGQGRRRTLECFVEGGPGSMSPGCSGGKCRLWPGTDVFEVSVCFGELELEWTW